MNRIDALYAVTRISWYELHQPEQSENLYLFRVCRGFKFPYLNEQSVVFPVFPGLGLHDSLLTFVFGTIWPSWKEFIPEDWLHFIEATVFALKKKSICDCCSGLIKYYER